jgi:hypothetical protein
VKKQIQINLGPKIVENIFIQTNQIMPQREQDIQIHPNDTGQNKGSHFSNGTRRWVSVEVYLLL